MPPVLFPGLLPGDEPAPADPASLGGIHPELQGRRGPVDEILADPPLELRTPPLQLAAHPGVGRRHVLRQILLPLDVEPELRERAGVIRRIPHVRRADPLADALAIRSEEHTSELQALMR